MNGFLDGVLANWTRNNRQADLQSLYIPPALIRNLVSPRMKSIPRKAQTPLPGDGQDVDLR
jgi:hypothetical protein